MFMLSFTDPVIVLSMFVIYFCDSMWSFWECANLSRIFLLFVSICIIVGDPIIMVGGLGSH